MPISSDSNDSPTDSQINSTVVNMQEETRKALLKEDKVSRIFKVQDFIKKKENSLDEPKEEQEKTDENTPNIVEKEEKIEKEEESEKKNALINDREEDKDRNSEEEKGRLKKISFLQSNLEMKQGPPKGK
jgi:hypothetical protein